MNRVLVTGASGYIGLHLIAELITTNHVVRGFGRNPPGAGLLDIEWFQGDIRHPEDVTRAVRECQTIIHLACLPLPDSWDDPRLAFDINTLGTVNLLKAAREANVERIIYISSAQVYGRPERLPIAERDPVQPVSPYAASKLSAEIACQTFARAYGIGIIVLRLFNVYGPSLIGIGRNTVEEIFLRQVRQGASPVIRPAAKEARDFIHISDVVRAMTLTLQGSADHEVINIGSGVMTSLLELAELIIDIAGGNMQPIVEGDLSYSPMTLQADIDKARNLLGFSPQVSLHDGLSRMVHGNS